MTTVRRIIFALFLVSAAGAAIELILLEHMEDPWQLVPLVLIGMALIAGPIAAWRSNRGTIRTFQALMVLFAVSGFTGIWLHYSGNAEFEVEMYPGLAGLELFWKSIKGATPALAPAFMLQLGALGFAWTWGHPGLEGRPGADTGG